VRDLAFDSPYRHGFARVAVAVPRVRVADPEANLGAILDLAAAANDARAAVVVFPELCLSSYALEDLFHQEVLVDRTAEMLGRLVDASSRLGSALVVGVPLGVEGHLFNCAAVVHQGRIAGIVPKSYLPNYREFYEKRHFVAARDAMVDEVTVHGQKVPFGTSLLFSATGIKHLVMHVEICEDLWVPIPPSSGAALAGATVLVNLSASNALVGKAEYRRLLCASQSARCISAYLYAAAGPGESTTDLAWDGQALIYENGERLAEARRFRDGQLIVADVDLERLVADRMRMTSFADAASDLRSRQPPWRRITLELEPPAEALALRRTLERFPYVPADPVRRNERCEEVHQIQVQGLRSRLVATGIEKVVLGVSGGLDSTEALLVAAKTMDALGLPRTNVLGVTMPGFATSARTLKNATRLVDALGATLLEIDIRPSAMQMLADLGHPAAAGAAHYDVTYENVQAGERTSHLFRLANHHHALVVGTGDLSELALGWCTYGVGDQMAHYSVNASVPKTLIRSLIAWIAATGELGPATEAVLADILATEISPELVPEQRSESTVGPFELVDFFLYHLVRFGSRPSRIAYLAHQAWRDPSAPPWPEFLPVEDRHAYNLAEIKRWLRVFLQRFFDNQFKRSSLPNAPKVGSGGSLSPRGDWRAPSDAPARIWLEELERNVP